MQLSGAWQSVMGQHRMIKRERTMRALGRARRGLWHVQSWDLALKWLASRVRLDGAEEPLGRSAKHPKGLGRRCLKTFT